MGSQLVVQGGALGVQVVLKTNLEQVQAWAHCYLGRNGPHPFTVSQVLGGLPPSLPDIVPELDEFLTCYYLHVAVGIRQV